MFHIQVTCLGERGTAAAFGGFNCNNDIFGKKKCWEKICWDVGRKQQDKDY